MHEHTCERAVRSAAWRKLEVYFPIASGHRAERALAQYKQDLAYQEKVRKSVNGEREPKQARAPKQTRLERWTARAAAFGTIWDFERECLAELPRGERGAARDNAIAECARAWRAGRKA